MRVPGAKTFVCSFNSRAPVGFLNGTISNKDTQDLQFDGQPGNRYGSIQLVVPRAKPQTLIMSIIILEPVPSK